jgi:hypothetical protein
MIRVWKDQSRVGNLTDSEVQALLGADDPKALRRAQDKLRAAEMVMLVWGDPDPQRPHLDQRLRDNTRT